MATDWSKERQNLLETITKYPNQAMNCIDSAYLAGLEATNNSVTPTTDWVDKKEDIE